MIPLRFYELSDNRHLFVGDDGTTFTAEGSFLDRYAFQGLTDADIAFLEDQGFPIRESYGLAYVNYCYNFAKRRRVRKVTDYFILVPTLRCNLSCSYCQVSRANEQAQGFDWDDATLASTIKLISASPAEHMKIEFQGGEPTLRLDAIERVIQALDATGKKVEYIICTNLAELTPRFTALLQHSNVYVSTSLDGSNLHQEKNRFQTNTATDQFYTNLHAVKSIVGTDRLSALPTIDPLDPPSYIDLIDSFHQLGETSIYLRPVNYQGFARKQHASSAVSGGWWEYYEGFIDFVIDHNFQTGSNIEEYYFAYCLRRIFDASNDTNVDIRNPNPAGLDYLLINYDGRIFPSDEARMLERIGEIDLSIGDIQTGIDMAKRDTLNSSAFNDCDPDCIHCAFQPFCGVDQVDSISRYGHIDLPKSQTFYCQLHTRIFEKIFNMLHAPTEPQATSISRWLRLPEVNHSFLAAHHD